MCASLRARPSHAYSQEKRREREGEREREIWDRSMQRGRAELKECERQLEGECGETEREKREKEREEECHT